MFRFNVDLWLDCRFAWTRDGFAIHDPSGRTIASADVTACLWRRPSLRDRPSWRGGSPDDRASIEAELHCLVRELAEWARARGRLRLIDPSGHRRVGRLAQMRVAESYFAVPPWGIGWGFRWPAGRRMVKRLTTEPLGPERNRHIFVQSVDAERLSPEFPWLTQDEAAGSRDATVVYVNGKSFGFQMARSRLELGVEDWRTLIGTGGDRWQPWAMPDGFPGRVAAYMDRLGLLFGRLDFLVGDGEPSFLEVNPSGQFGWLDDPSGWPLHRAVLDAVLDPGSSVRGGEAVREGEP